jgi:hypothetical protein
VDFNRSSRADLVALIHAQYALAPRLLIAGTVPDVVIAAAREGGEIPAPPDGFVLEQVLNGRFAILRRVK